VLGPLLAAGAALVLAPADALEATVTTTSLTLTRGGAAVTSLAPGDHVIAVDDRSPIANVHLEGPGVSRDSGLGFVGTTSWPVTLRDGVYTVVSDPQGDSLSIRVVVGTPPAPQLRATVTDGAVTLADAGGAAVTQLAPGTYAIAVEDSSTLESLRLVGPGVNEHTQRHTRSSALWIVTLADGVYTLYSERRPDALRTSVRVGSGSAAPAAELHGVSGSDFGISLVGRDHAPARRLPEGTYRLVVDDRSPDHNFHLRGPGVDVATLLPETGTRAFAVRLRPGTYTFLCDPHILTMVGQLVVTGAAPARLTATLARDGRVTVSAGRLRPGLYAIEVRDRSPRAALRLTGPGVRRATGAAFTGTVTWRVRLARGTYRLAGPAGTRLLRIG
jgi:hypothetical protein